MSSASALRKLGISLSARSQIRSPSGVRIRVSRMRSSLSPGIGAWLRPASLPFVPHRLDFADPRPDTSMQLQGIAAYERHGIGIGLFVLGQQADQRYVVPARITALWPRPAPRSRDRDRK